MTILLSLLLTSMGDAANDPAAAARAIIADKTKLPARYHLSIRREGRIPDAPQPLESAWGSTIQIWRDGDKLRVDNFDSHHTPPRKEGAGATRVVSCLNCERPGYGIVTTIEPDNPVRGVKSIEFHKLGSRNFDLTGAHIDWRYFGLANEHLGVYAKLNVPNEYPAMFVVKGLKERRDVRDGVACRVFDYQSEKVHRSVWISEMDGNHPIYFEEVLFLSNEAPQKRSTEIKWLTSARGYTFPQHVRHRTVIYTNNSRYNSESEYTVTTAIFGAAIDPEVFTIAGLRPNENQRIAFPELKAEDRPHWRNGKIDYDDTVKKRMEDEAERRPSTDRGRGGRTAGYPVRDGSSLTVAIVAASVSVTFGTFALIARRKRGAA